MFSIIEISCKTIGFTLQIDSYPRIIPKAQFCGLLFDSLACTFESKISLKSIYVNADINL